MKIETFQYQGNREYQQDAYYANDKTGLFIVCDGVGGSIDGGRASGMVIDSLTKYILENKSTSPPKLLKEAIYKAQNQLVEYLKENPEFDNSGTTVAIVMIQDSIAFTAHMGDSKILFIKNKSKVCWQTKDHSMVQELFDADIIKSEKDMFSHPLRNRITNGLFARRKSTTLNIPINELNNVSQGDLFILCTDGVLESYLPSELNELYASSSISEVTNTISQKVGQNSRDNSTFILIQV